MKKLHIDIETYSSVDLKTAGLYKYSESPDFDILLIAYAIDTGPVQMIDLSISKKIPSRFIDLLQDPEIINCAHNANFERVCFNQVGIFTPINFWECTMVKAAYCGYPLSLAKVSEALGLNEKGKLSTGRALIKYFCGPCKPTKTNGQRLRNLPEHDPEAWEQFKEYCKNDVEAEREIDSRLSKYTWPEFERQLYALDQQINDIGILIDLDFAKNAVRIDNKARDLIKASIKKLTGVDNPNSAAQLKDWLSEALGKEIKTLAKDAVAKLLENTDTAAVSEVLQARQKLGKTSVKKYQAMLKCAAEDNRAHGVFQFYGANRTGRWAGRLIQLQNLPRNYINDLDAIRSLVKSGKFEDLKLLFENIPNVLSELIRTSFIPAPGHLFAVADFSAIEARVLSWLAEEQWRLDVFNSHGKIYEASAAMMFGVPVESVTKGSKLRQQGKIAELALGYQGAVGAMTQMDRSGDIPEGDKKMIVEKWRKANPAIVKFWHDLEKYAIHVIKTKKTVKYKCLELSATSKAFTIKLPSGRSLFYIEPKIGANKWGRDCILFKGMDQTVKKWTDIDTYGGKLTENIVQAIARDLLANSMLRVNQWGYGIVMHVHDEIIAEVPKDDAEDDLRIICNIMGEEIPWAKGLPLTADGYITQFYKKD